MNLDLDQATRVTGSDGEYCTRLSSDWEIWGPNGGYLAAIAMRAASMLATIRQPASLYCHFLSSPKFDDVQLNVETLKQGRRSESFSVRMQQHGKPILQALIRTAADAPGYEYQEIGMPDVPQPHDLKSYDQLRPNNNDPHYSFWKNAEARPVNQSVFDQPTNAVALDWVRFMPRACFDDLFVDASRALILLDTYGWPAAHRARPNGAYIAPNLDTSVWFHRFNPSSEWLLIDHACPVAGRGLMGVNGRVWDVDGNLLATGAAQLCCLPSAIG